MAKRSKPAYYFEPWEARRSQSHGSHPFPNGIPENYPEGVGEALIDTWEKRDRNASWVIWGSKMAEPADGVGLLGAPYHMDDQRIIAIQSSIVRPEGSVDSGAIASRIAACVNAFAGVGDPAAFMADVRALLMSVARGEMLDPEDSQVYSLLSRCIPPNEMERLHAETQECEA